MTDRISKEQFNIIDSYAKNHDVKKKKIFHDAIDLWIKENLGR